MLCIEIFFNDILSLKVSEVLSNFIRLLNIKLTLLIKILQILYFEYKKTVFLNKKIFEITCGSSICLSFVTVIFKNLKPFFLSEIICITL